MRHLTLGLSADRLDRVNHALVSQNAPSDPRTAGLPPFATASAICALVVGRVPGERLPELLEPGQTPGA